MAVFAALTDFKIKRKLYILFIAAGDTILINK